MSMSAAVVTPADDLADADLISWIKTLEDLHRTPLGHSDLLALRNQIGADAFRRYTGMAREWRRRKRAKLK